MIWKQPLASSVRKSLAMLIDYEVISDPPEQSGRQDSQSCLDNNPITQNR